LDEGGREEGRKGGREGIPFIPPPKVFILDGRGLVVGTVPFSEKGTNCLVSFDTVFIIPVPGAERDDLHMIEARMR
jgi:hypothetical protein